MPTVDDLFNQLVTVNQNLVTMHNDLANLTSTLHTDLVDLRKDLIALGEYTNDALYQNDLQNDTIICTLDHISRNTCSLLNEAAVQTALQTEMESDIDGLESMFAAANPGAALERERLHRLEEQIEKCCPPPKPTPPCTFTPCPAPVPIGRPTKL